MACPAVSEGVSRELFGLITEFFQWHDFPLTLEALAAERKAKRKQVSSSVSGKPLAGKERSSACSALLRKFDDGKRDEFFALWQQYMPAAMLARHADTHKAEFHLQIYFALYPILPKPSLSLSATSNATSAASAAAAASGSSPSSRQELAQRMRVFKHCLESQGAGQVASAELLPFYALPYVPHPETHPSYQHMFDGQWSTQQRRSLKAFLEAIPGQDVATPPGLYMLYAQAVQAAQAAAADAAEGSTAPAAPTAQQHHSAVSATIGSRPVSALLKGEAELSDVIRAADDSNNAATGAVLALGAGYDAVHSDVAGCAAGNAPGAAGASEALHSSSLGSFATQQQPSEALPPIHEHSDDADDADGEDAEDAEDPDASNADADGADVDPGNASNTEEQVVHQNSTAHATCATTQPQTPAAAARPKAYHLADLAPLDYIKIKAGLQSGQVQLVARLLQALRWRLTCCAAGVERFAVMTGWIEWDLLGMHDAPPGAGSIAEIVMSSQDPAVCYQLARLLNAIASDRAGRAYLLQQCSHTVGLLLQLLTSKGSQRPGTGSTRDTSATGTTSGSATNNTARSTADTPLQQQALAALQKLSLKRRAQSAMIAQGALEWVVGFLGSAVAAAAAAVAPAAVASAVGSSRRASARSAGSDSGSGSASGSRRQSASDATAAAEQQPQHLAAAAGTATVADAIGAGADSAAAAASRLSSGKRLPLSEFSVEYGAALLMNLVLRRAGKARCEGCAVALLRVCIGMMESPNEQVRTYINGTLYATLSRASIRHAAASLGLERLLHDVTVRSTPTFARQINFIQRQLSLNASAGDVTARDRGDGASDDDDAPPDGDAYADDGDDGSFLDDADEEDAGVTGSPDGAAVGKLAGGSGDDKGTGAVDAVSAFGEELLATAYLAGPEEAKSELELMRASIGSCALKHDSSCYSGCSGLVSTAAAVRGSASFYGDTEADAPPSRPVTPAGAGAANPHHGSQAISSYRGPAAAGGSYRGQLQSGHSNMWRADGAAGKQVVKKGGYSSANASYGGGGAIAAAGARGSLSYAQPRHYQKPLT